MSLKTYICLSVYLSNVPDKYRSHNGNAQFTILIRAKTKKRVQEILGMSYKHLTEFCGCHVTDSPLHSGIVQKDETIYYHVSGVCKGGGFNEWVEYVPRTKT